VVLTTANFEGFSNICRYYTRSQTGKSTGYRHTLKPLNIEVNKQWNIRVNDYYKKVSLLITGFWKKITESIRVAFFFNYIIDTIDGVTRTVSMLASSVIDCVFETIKLVFVAFRFARYTGSIKK